jgi:hypothetical protein
MENNVEKKKVVEDIRKEIEASKESHIWCDYVNALKLISQVVFTRSSGFILELIQNAEDAGLGLENPGVFEIRLNQDRVKIMHNGRPFSDNDVKALCGIRSSKKPERGTLGYLGIGFKSVFKVTDRPEVYSNGFQFKFDRNHKDWIDPGNTPWHVIPIWVDEPTEIIDTERTTFIIPYREKAYYTSLLEEVEKLRTGIYLFLRWLKKIKVINEVSGEAWTLENAGDSKDGITTLKHDGQKQRFKLFSHPVEIPDWVKQDRLTQEYRANVSKREIVIAFALDGEDNLTPSEAGAMYGGVQSFTLLGEERSGAKFPIQADFLVQPGREAINYEAKWNHWLLEEVTTLCKEAINFFKKHEKWRYQFLPAFEFTKSKGLESYDKLFGPKLIDPIEKFLEEDDCIPTTDGNWAKSKQVVRLTEDEEATEDLITMGILRKEEIAPVMGGQPDLKLVHPDVIDCNSNPIRKVSRWDILENDNFLKGKTQALNSANWSRALYKWLLKYPVYEDYRPYRAHYARKRVIGYHKYEFILTTDKRLLKGGEVSLLDVPSQDTVIKDLADILQTAKPMLHPGILVVNENEEEQKALRGFLIGLTGVQVLDSKKICKEVLLPKILTNAPKLSLEDMLKYTIYCQQILGKEIDEDLEFWVLTKQGDVRAAKEVLFPIEFKPEQGWEKHQQYVSGINFISQRYVEGITSDNQLEVWREFFIAGGVKNAPDNGVEEFAMNYAKEKLNAHYKSVTLVDKRNFGYDIEAETQTGEKMHVEVKGQSSEKDVELTDNETKAADKHKDTFYLCVVSSIPKNPSMYMVKDPSRVGNKDKLTIPVDIWKIATWP